MKPPAEDKVIPLNSLIIAHNNNGTYELGVVTMFLGAPMFVGIIGFTDKNELPEMAQVLYDRVINLMKAWDPNPLEKDFGEYL